jgi:hypothetical protein
MSCSIDKNKKLKLTTRAESSAVTQIFRTLSILAVLVSGTALGQRGIVEHNPNENDSPLSGIQGFFDTHLTAPGKFSIDIPSFQVDYGINDRWSVGVNGLAILAALSAEKPPTLGLKARHSIFANDALQMTMSGYFFQVSNQKKELFEPAEESTLIRATFANLNIAKNLSSHEIGLSTLYSRLSNSVRTLQTQIESRSETHAISTSLWWRWTAYHRIGTELLGFVTPVSVLLQDSPLANSRQLNVSPLGPSFARALINWRSSDRWLWNVGVIGSTALPMKLLPYLGFTLLIPQYDSAIPEEKVQ